MTEFNASRMTIIRDINALSVTHPIYTVQGNGGGVLIDEDYYIGKQYMKKSECELLEKLALSLQGDDAKVMANILKTFTFPKK